VSQAQQSAELLCPFRQLLLMEAYQRRPVMGKDGHPLLDDSALQAFVTHWAGAARE
jgi:hypothetical protein